MKTARPIFKNKVEEISSKLGIDKPKKIGIKKLKSIGQPYPFWYNKSKCEPIESTFRYNRLIILHELCHPKIKEHSHHYWDLVQKYMPDYQEKIDWLKVNGTVLV